MIDEQNAKKTQRFEDAKVVPALFAYWAEHGKKAERADAIASSLRIFIGFLMQDEVGVAVTMANADRAMWQRFMAWRLGPHEYAVPWSGKTITAKSEGVKGETVHSDLARVAAALNHQVEYGRIPIAPKIPSVDKRLRSDPREFRYTVEQMGAIMMVAAYDPEMFRWLVIQVATLVRPVAALKFDPRTQYDAGSGLIDLHPNGAVRTKKRNPVVPSIPEIRPMLAQWAKDGAVIVASRKTAWRNIRRLLDLPPEAEAKTFRYTIATMLRSEYRIDKEQIETLLGHTVLKSVSARYAKYDPSYLAEATVALSSIFRRVARAALDWGAVHLLASQPKGRTIVIKRSELNTLEYNVKNGAAYRTRTCDPRITNARKGRQKRLARERRAAMMRPKA